MKNVLLLLASVLILPGVLGAQSSQVTGLEVSSTKAEYRHAPVLVDLADNQLIMGHYDSDSLSEYGMGMNTTGSYSLAVMLEPEELEIFNHGKIVAFRVGLAESAAISKVFVVPVLAKGKYGSRISWSCDVSSVGWNEVQLDTPWEINLDEGQQLLIGFVYKQELEAHPLSVVKEGIAYDTYTYTKTGSVGKWKPIDMTEYGNLSVQCIVESDNFPDNKISCYGLSSIDYVKAGEDLPFSIHINNKGLKSVDDQALVTNLLIDSVQVATIANDASFKSNYLLQGNISTVGIESGEHVLTVQPAIINGELIENPPSQDYTFKLYQRSYPRQSHLVEQLTSTYCTYCPLGNSMLSILTSQRDDVIWVGIHGNLGSGVDKFRSNQGDSIMAYMTGGSVSYPSAAFDRSTGWDDDVNIVSGIGYYEDYHQLVADLLGDFFDYLTGLTPTFAEINADCQVDEVTREATIKIYGDIAPDFGVLMGEDATLSVYLVEDSLVASQLNDGSWVRDYVHNGVFRKALGSVLGVKIGQIDDYYENTFTLTIPQAWIMEHMHVVAFISRPMANAVNGYTDMRVNNAASFRLLNKYGGVEESLIDNDAVPVGYYDLTGRQFDGPQQGINLVKMSNGIVKKVLVRQVTPSPLPF